METHPALKATSAWIRSGAIHGQPADTDDVWIPCLIQVLPDERFRATCEDPHADPWEAIVTLADIRLHYD